MMTHAVHVMRIGYRATRNAIADSHDTSDIRYYINNNIYIYIYIYICIKVKLQTYRLM